MDIEQVYAEESRMNLLDEINLNVTENWKKYRFPYPVDLAKQPNWSEAGLNLSVMKKLLTDMELRNGSDYIFCRPGPDSDPRDGMFIRFKDDAEGLMAIMRWVASDWYRNRR